MLTQHGLNLPEIIMKNNTQAPLRDARHHFYWGKLPSAIFLLRH